MMTSASVTYQGEKLRKVQVLAQNGRWFSVPPWISGRPAGTHQRKPGQGWRSPSPRYPTASFPRKRY